MSKTRIFALTAIALMLAAVLTNPSKEKFERAIKDKAQHILKKQLNYEHEDALQLGMTLFGDRIVQEFVDANIAVKNYYLFSVVELRWQGKQTPIGGGAFTKIWLSERLDEEADKIIELLKDHF